MKRVKFSLATKFTLIILLIIVLKAGTLSAVFLNNLYSISNRLVRTNVEKSVNHLQNNIASLLSSYVDMLDYASYGVGVLFNHGNQDFFDTEGLARYFDMLVARIPEMEMLYFTGNIKWNQSGGHFVSSPAWIPDDSWDQTERPWFLAAKEGDGAIVFSSPYLDAQSDEVTISISRTIADEQGNDIGVIAADMLVTMLNTEITRTRIFPEQLLYLLDKEGLFITNENPDKVMMRNFFEEYNEFERYYEDILSHNTFHIQADTYDFFSASIPQSGWYLVSVTPNSVISSEPNQILMDMLLLSLVIIAVAVCASIIFTYYMVSRPLNDILKVFTYLDSNDLTVQLEEISHDEIGDLKNAFNAFLNKLNATFTAFSNNADMVSTAVLEISSSAREITATANEQSASVAEIVSTMENNKELSSQIALKTTGVVDMAVRTQDLSQRGADLREANEDMMLDIRNQNAKTTEVIKNLADMLSRIDESVQLIDTFADNTKLIAFNAALEASSSGEAGSRFAVVASEIRRFAGNVAESVVEIKEKISDLQEASQTLIVEADNGSLVIDEGYSRMVEQKEVFENIVDVSQQVATSSQQISGLSKQQETALAQVFIALKEISSGVSRFVTSTALTSATADNLNKMSIELKETLARYHIGNRRIL